MDQSTHIVRKAKCLSVIEQGQKRPIDMTVLLLTAPFVRKHSVSAVRKLSVCMPTPFPEST